MSSRFQIELSVNINEKVAKTDRELESAYLFT